MENLIILIGDVSKSPKINEGYVSFELEIKFSKKRKSVEKRKMFITIRAYNPIPKDRAQNCIIGDRLYIKGFLDYTQHDTHIDYVEAYTIIRTKHANKY